MSTKSLVIELKNTICEIRDEHGVAEVKCDNLITYLEEIIGSPEEIGDIHMEKYKAQLQHWVKQNEASQASSLEMFRSVISTGQSALKTAFLMNGGATIALLAFLGKLSGQHQDKIAIFASSLIMFVFGVVTISMASGSTYLSQLLYASAKSHKRKIGLSLHILTVVFGFLSYGFFIWGAIRAYNAFIGFANETCCTSPAG